MRLNTNTAGFTVFLGLVIGMIPLSTDIFVPSLPALAEVFGVEVATVQLTMTGFFIGLACGQLLYGPLSDRYGRRPLLLTGLALYCAATLYCANAESILDLVGGRFFQALGAASGPVLGRSIVRDLHVWDKAAQMLALTSIVFGFVPIVAPLAGAALLAAWGWTASFWLVGAIAAVLFVVVAVGLPETAPHPRAGVPTPAALARNFGFLLGQPHFLAYMLAVFFAQAGIFAFVSNSSFVLIQALGYSVTEYGLVYSAVMVGHISGAWASSRGVLVRGIDGTIRIGALLTFGSGVVLAGLAWLRVESALAIVIPMFFFMLGTALVVPHATAAALSPYPKIAGAAASLSGFVQLTGGAVISWGLGALFDGTPRPLATAVALSGAATLALYLFVIRRLAPHPTRGLA